VIWIGYTTLYREGGPKFERAARTLANTKRAAAPHAAVRCERVESKRDFVDAMKRIEEAGHRITELHFVGHSGMYGPMFRTSSLPEQFSPYEWRGLRLPFAEGGRAYFHACRTARWLAPFFARTFGVTAYGYHGYTTISRRPDAFAWESPFADPEAPLHVVACPGKKSHGIAGSIGKYLGIWPIERMQPFHPEPLAGGDGYDGVADLYDAVFADITVRRDEWRWLREHLRPGPLRILDVGCGNGAMLRALESRIESGVGVDRSGPLLAHAKRRAAGSSKLAFHSIDGPQLPFPNASFDVVVSLLSFRYLDWDPIMNEMRRVLAPQGRILIVDMVTAPLQVVDVPAFARDKARKLVNHVRNRTFARALRRLVSDPRWRGMLRHNPIRAEHELVWYLQSRYPGARIERLNVSWDARVLAFDSGPLERGWVAPQSYP